MRIKIDAFDTLYFRDGKPFTMGSETSGSGIFPPYPSMLYGALRSVYFSYNADFLKYANTEHDPTKDLEITGIYLARKGDIYFPLPFDCVQEKGAKNKKAENKFIILKPTACSVVSNCGSTHILRPENNLKIENIVDGWIDKISFEVYLNSNHEDAVFTESDFLVISEPKIGIGRNNLTKTAQDSMLYRVAMKRMIETSIVVEFEGLNLPEQGLIKFGGEGRPVNYETINENMIPKPPEQMGKVFKLYFSTPAIFEKGWLPKWIDENTLEGQYDGLRLKLITASIGRVIYIGGFNMKLKEPKPMKRAVPAGSVYYFEIIENKQDLSPVELFHGRAISDIMPEQGFGIAYTGIVK